MKSKIKTFIAACLLLPAAMAGAITKDYSQSEGLLKYVASIFPFSSCLQPCPASGSFPMCPFFTLGGQNIVVSASSSVLPMNIQD